MSWTLAKVSLLLLFAQLAASITIQMKKNEQFCTWKHLDQDMDFTGEYIVSGYSEKKFGMTIYSPENKLLKKIEGKREGSWNLKVALTGEHKICFRSFDNKQKYVTFNMNNGEVQDATVKTEYFEHMKDLVFDANRLLRKISQNQRFQNTRGMIHIQNAEALASRLNWTTFFKALILVGIAAGQLYVLTGFFRKRKASFV